MEIRDRIKIIMERENMTSGVFAESIGIQQSTLSHIINGRNNPSLDVVTKVQQKYNYIRLDWLVYGTGNMTDQFTPSGNSMDYLPSLFDQSAINTPTGTNDAEKRKETAFQVDKNTPKEIVKQEVRYIEKPHRKITEIRIFFDDNTYEIFKGEK